MFILQVLVLITLAFFINTYAILTLWYLAGLYLVLLGLWLLIDDGDIFVGFLWVIDLGVGLIFFIFIIHYSSFLNQKANIEKSSRDATFFFLSLFVFSAFMFFLAEPLDESYEKGLNKSWIFFLCWYDYYDFFFSQTVTDLNLLRELYFVNNSLEFFIINFVLFYGIICAILFSFFLKKSFNIMNLEQLLNYKTYNKTDVTFFIRSQDFTKQHYAPSGTRVWSKKKYN